MSKFSIIIPAYKAKYLAEAIESVLGQSFQDFELIVVDDASPENLASIVKRHNDPRLRYYRNEKNCGAERVVDNWNICLGYATGEYVICMGDDDRLLPTCLEEYNTLINKYPDLDVYHGWTQIIDEQGEPYQMQEPRPERENVYSMMWNRWKGRMQYIGDFCYRTSSLKEHGGYFFLPMAWASDDISAYIAAGEKGIANTQSPVFQYRISPSTLSESGNAKYKVKAIVKERQWVEEKIKTKPQNSIEQIFHKSIKKELSKHFRVKLQSTLVKDIANQGLKHWVWWLKERHNIGISYSVFMWITILAIKTKIAHKD